MVNQVIRKAISIIIVSSLILCKLCTSVEAKDLKLSFVYILNTVENIEKDPIGTNTIFDYNKVGQVVSERSIDNNIRSYTYDRAVRLISKVNKDRSKIAYDYDENDNLIILV